MTKMVDHHDYKPILSSVPLKIKKAIILLDNGKYLHVHTPMLGVGNSAKLN